MTESISNASELSHKPVSQRHLIWRRFKRHKLGVIGGITLIFLALIFIFAEFVAPYEYSKPHPRLSYLPPMIDRIHWDGFAPFVYEIRTAPATIKTCETCPPSRLPGVWDLQENTEKKHYIKFFTKGDPYKLWGLFDMDIHLFGTDQPPASKGQFFVFGTNNQGVDVFSQTLMAGRTTLAIAPLVILVSFLLGTVVGGFSGYLAGGWDTFLQRIAEIFMSLPRLALLLTVFGMLPSMFGFIPPEVRFWSIVLLLSAITWAPLSRVIRGQFLALRESEFTQAARALGAGDFRIVFRQILPNIMSYIIVAATLSIPDIIILESILSFLGYGIKFPMTSWGELLNVFQGSGFNFQMQYHPWLLIPAIFIVITVLALNFLGDALRDAFDPFNVVGGEESM